MRTIKTKLKGLITKKRKGSTFVETMFSLLCVSLMIVVMLSVVVSLKTSTAKIRSYVLLENQIIGAAEIINTDIYNGEDVLAEDYTKRVVERLTTFSGDINQTKAKIHTIRIFPQEGILNDDKILYLEG